MSCFSYKNINLRSGSLHQYNTNLGSPVLLTTKTHYSTNTYSTLNYNNAYGVAEYERILGIIETYTGKLNFCPNVNDLAVTYNALMKELGSSNHVMNKAEFMKYADQRDSMLPAQPQGKSAIRSKKAASRTIHQLRGRGVDSGNVFLDVKAVVQGFQNEKRIKEEERVQAQLNLEIEAIKAEKIRLEQIRINEQKKKDELQRLKQIEIENERRIAEEERVQRELDREMQEIKAAKEEKLRLEQIRINQQKQKEHDEKIRLEEIEQQRLQKIANDEEIRLEKILKEKVRQDEIKRAANSYKVYTWNPVIPEITPEIVATSSILIPLGIIGLLLYSRTGRK
tara:strand:- start:1425 stop:2441 length:1017 start_codon:yes stop_codon:yes gene_type:complete